MKRLITLIFVALACVLSIHAYKQQNITIKVNGQNRNMIVYTPSTTAKNMPLMIIRPVVITCMN